MIWVYIGVSVLTVAAVVIVVLAWRAGNLAAIEQEREAELNEGMS